MIHRTECKTIPTFFLILNLKRVIHLQKIKKKVARKNNFNKS